MSEPKRNNNDTNVKKTSQGIDNMKGSGIMSNEKKTVRIEDIPNATQTKIEYVNRLGNVPSAYEARLKLRARQGWHQYWAAPGADYERCMASGMYAHVREPSDEQRKTGKWEPGEEAGEVIKIVNNEGKVELIALECPMDAYVEYLHWMEQESTRRYTAIKEQYYNAIEGLNSAVGGRGRQFIAGEVNDEGNFKPL